MGSTDSFLPGSWKAAAGEGDSETAAAEPEACAAEGVTAESVESVGAGVVMAEPVESGGAGVAVAESAAAEVVPDGIGTDETPITTIGGEPDAEGERVDADAEAVVDTEAVADTEAVGDTGTDDRPITTIPDAVELADVSVVTEEDVAEVEASAVVDAVEETVALDSETVDDAVDAELMVDEAEAVAVVEAVVAVDDELLVLVLEDVAVAEAEDDDCMVTVHVFTSCTASFP